ncbi:MAG: photosystem I reaction center subunit IV [Halioglobus sp.]|nr:photosystem I reaction center subunit IV [Halioglobus sp.]
MSVRKPAIPGAVALLLLMFPMLQVLSQDNAPIMPLAPQALLLDITTAGQRLVVAGEHGIILYSDDNADSWQQASVPTTQMLTGVYFVDDRLGWAVGHDGLILVSEDGAGSWRVQRDGLSVQHQANLEVRETAHRQIRKLEQAVAQADDEARPDLELALEDAQLDLEDAELTLSEPVFTSPLMDVWFQDGDRGWAVGAFGTFVTTRDGGEHWISQRRKLENPFEYHLNAITGDGEGGVFIAGEGGVMYRSLDGGQSWESLEPFYEGSWFGVVYDAPHRALLVFGLRGNIFRSTDFGTTWEAVSNESHITLAGGTASARGDVVLAGSVGTVMTSSDGGTTFRRTQMDDGLSLSSGIRHGERLILIGQGGIKTVQESR